MLYPAAAPNVGRRYSTVNDLCEHLLCIIGVPVTTTQDRRIRFGSPSGPWRITNARGKIANNLKLQTLAQTRRIEAKILADLDCDDTFRA